MSRPQIESLESRQLLSAAVASGSAPWSPPDLLAEQPSGHHAQPSAKRAKKAKADPATTALAISDVQNIISAAASQAKPTQAVAVTDREGTLLGVFLGNGLNPNNLRDASSIEFGIALRAVQRARTAAFFQSSGEAFTTRTARFIIQNHFPEPIKNTAGGPLYGVEFSSLPGTDILLKAHDASGNIIAGAPGIATGISGDPGGVPLFIRGVPVGGIGVAGDFNDIAPAKSLLPISFIGGVVGDERFGDAYGQLANPKGRAFDQAPYDGKELSDFDESVAMTGARAYRASPEIQATKIFVGGLRFPFTASHRAGGKPVQTLTQLTSGGGHLVPLAALGLNTADIRAGEPEKVNANFGGVPGLLRITNNIGFVDSAGMPDPTKPHLNPQDSDQIIDSNDANPVKLTKADVMQVFNDAVHQAAITRAGIRKPNGRNVVVHVVVVDRDGTVLGAFRMEDGTNFSYDVAVQKARTAAFFSDDTHAFTARAIGFMSQRFFPPGIDSTDLPGPLFGLQDLLSVGVNKGDIGSILKGPNLNGPLPNGITIFPGGAPLYKEGQLVGAVGVSGDGVDQDDLVTFAGTLHFRPPPSAVRSDQFGGQEAASYLVGKLQEIANTIAGANLSDSDPQKQANKTALSQIVDQAQARLPKALARVGLPYVKFPRNPLV